jgi:hypothetical protein
VTFGDPANSSTIATITAAKPTIHTLRLFIVVFSLDFVRI